MEKVWKSLISTNHHSPGGGRLDLNQEATRRGDSGIPRTSPASAHIIVHILIVLVPVTGGTAVVQGAGARM